MILFDICNPKQRNSECNRSLPNQGEQIEKIEGGLDSINADMGLAEKALKAMDLACGIFPKFWKKSEGFKEDDAIWGEQKGGGAGHLERNHDK